jgi:hypothetical protein
LIYRGKRLGDGNTLQDYSLLRSENWLNRLNGRISSLKLTPKMDWRTQSDQTCHDLSYEQSPWIHWVGHCVRTWHRCHSNVVWTIRTLWTWIGCRSLR